MKEWLHFNVAPRARWLWTRRARSYPFLTALFFSLASGVIGGAIVDAHYQSQAITVIAPSSACVQRIPCDPPGPRDHLLVQWDAEKKTRLTCMYFEPIVMPISRASVESFR